VSPVKYEVGFYITEDGILHSHRRENLKSYKELLVLTAWTLQQRSNLSPVRYELGSYISEDRILHSHHRENLKSYIALTCCALYQRSTVSLLRYELGFYMFQKTAFFIVTAVKT
jgi:hypothetical protein